MSAPQPFLRLVSAMAGALLLTASVGLAIGADNKAEEEDNTRAVRVIEAPDGTPSGPLPAQPAAQPPSGPAPPAAAAPPPHPSDYPAQRKQTALGAIPIDNKAANPAEVSVELLPGLDVAVGAKVSFRVTTKKAGYVVLVDVDADGKLTQIFPAPSKLIGGRAARPNSNYIAPGKPLIIPPSGAGSGGIEYVASPPTGVAMVVAILSDRPVQILDLPDVPTALTGQAEALAFLTKFARELRIPQRGGRLQEARWSFDAKFYAIR